MDMTPCFLTRSSSKAFRQSPWSGKGPTCEGEKPLTCFSTSKASWECSRSVRRWENGGKEIEEKEETLLGGSAAPLPDLDHHHALCISHTGPSHMHEHKHSQSHMDCHFAFHKSFFDAATNEHGVWKAEKKNPHQCFPFNYPDIFALRDPPGFITAMKFNAWQNPHYLQLLNPHGRGNQMEDTQQIYTERL